jgi:hypothetical protein
MTKGEKRNYKMDAWNFLHGMMEHILQIKEMEHKKWNIKKSKSLKTEWRLRRLLFSYYEGGRREEAASKPGN